METNDKEELVYEKSFLPFEGTLPAQSGTSTEIKINYWDTEAFNSRKIHN